MATTIYNVMFQRAADAPDPRDSMTREGENFSELCREAAEDGYPRVISAEQRTVTPWVPVLGFKFDEPTP